MPSITAVQVFGNFSWPPLSGGDKSKAQGTVSIIYKSKNTSSPLHAWLQWEPAPDGSAPQAPRDTLPDFRKLGSEKQLFLVALKDLKKTLVFDNGFYYKQSAPRWNDKHELTEELAVTMLLGSDAESAKYPALKVQSSGAEVICTVPRFVNEGSSASGPCFRVGLSLPEWEYVKPLHNLLQSGRTTSAAKWPNSQIKALFAILNIHHKIPKDVKFRYQVRLGPRGICHEFGPIAASMLTDRGVLRYESSHLVVAFDDIDRTRVSTNQSKFQLRATVAWDVNEERFSTNFHEKESVNLSITPEVVWTSAWPLKAKPPASKTTNGMVTAYGLLTAAFRRTAKALDSLDDVEGGLVDCALPQLCPKDSKLDGSLAPQFALAFSQINTRQRLRGDITPTQLETKDLEAHSISVPAPFVATDTVPQIGFCAAFPRLENRVDGRTFFLRHSVASQALSRDGSRVLMQFNIVEDAHSTSKGIAGRVSGLLFDGHNYNILAQASGNESHLTIGLPPEEKSTTVVVSADGSKVPGSNVRVTWNWRFAIETIQPVRGDCLWGNREPDTLPLLIREGANAPASGQQYSPFVLRVNEEVSPRDDRLLVCEIIENDLNQTAEFEMFTVLSRNPRSVLRFARQPLRLLGDAQNAVVATYDSDERSWLFKLVAPEYHFQFPPQGIGESADKPRFLEMHDINLLKKNPGPPTLPGPDPRFEREDVILNADGSLNFLRPVPLKSQTGTLPRRSYVVECRYTPSLELWVKPSDLERGYYLAEWNARELFRQKNDFGLGVSLQALRGEFLYGMSVGVDPSKEPGLEKLARVAELEALVGILPQRTYLESSEDLPRKLSRRWQLLRAVLMGRHERLEVWTPTYDQARPFVPARFEAGTSFALRTTALHRNPTLKESDFTAEEAPSKPNQLRVKNLSGLSGGAIWPIESIAHWQMLQTQPAFTEGRIERIAVSPTGGDADQSASFAQGLVTIASETRAGYVQRQRVEILGRAGVFWNRAKHVVIYDRTVNPSEQFAPELDSAGWATTRSRRAVIRKVMEYIEFLEPVRSYPDDPEAKGMSCGFLDSSRFQKIIFVDSAWGRDIDQDGVKGYVIPLWNPRAARQRPNVYPFPNITFVTIGEGKEERPLIPRQCANPENVFFYAQASPIEGDTNKWSAVFDVDFGKLIDPDFLEKNFAPGGSDHGAPFPVDPNSPPVGRKPSPQRILPGHHRFTWRLLPDSAKTTLNAGFGEKPVYGAIDSFTFSRGEMADSEEANFKQHAEYSKSVASFSLAPAAITRHLGMLSQIEGELTGTAPTKSQRAALDNVIDELKAIKRGLFVGADSPEAALDKFKAEGDKYVKLLGLDGAPLNCDAIKRRLQENIRRQLRAVAHELNSRQLELEKAISAITEAQLKAAWDAYSGKIKDPKDRLVRALGDVIAKANVVSGLIAQAHTDVDKVLGDVEAAARVIHDTIADLDNLLGRSAARLQAILAECNTAVDWTASRYEKLREQIHDELQNLPAELNAATANFAQRLAAEIGSTGWPIVDAVVKDFAKLLAEKVTQKLQLAIPIEWTPAAIPATFVKSCHDKISDAQKGLAELESKLRESLNKATTALYDSVNKATADVRTASDRVLSGAAIVPALVSNVAQDLIDEIDRAWQKAENIPAQLAALQKAMLNSVPLIGELLLKNKDLDQALSYFPAEVESLCKALPTNGLNIDYNGLVDDLKKCKSIVDDAVTRLQNAANDVTNIKKAIGDIGTDFSAVRESILSAGASAHAYTTRLTEGFSQLAHSPLKAGPSNILRIMAAATAAPEIGQLQSNIDRMRCAYKDTQVQITKIRASLARLGDALKALGIDIPTDALTEKLEIPPDILQKYDISRLFPNFGGISLKNLLPDVKVPKGAKDAIRISHDFDRKQFRAWVQVDVNYPINGRKELYSFGPFAVYFRDSSLTGNLRAEASKDTTETKTTARSRIDTHIDVDVAGQRLLSLEKVALCYEQGSGMKFEFDPKSIRLQAALQFVQDTLGGLFGDNIGGLHLIKEKGLPVGVEHVFTLPTISIMAGTSGVSNIQLGNLFRLLAYPEFVITNQFNLSKPELPFLFSFFIVGGTGYVIIDATYRPLDSALTVGVECAAGGSAALGFSIGPVSGSVFIAFNLVITYRKTFGPGGASGDGLIVSVQLVIAGHVSLWGLVDVYLGILLRMSYQENGAIDALGSLSVSVKICAFVTLSFSTDVTYRLKNGKSETTVNTSTSVDSEAVKQMSDRADQLEHARE